MIIVPFELGASDDEKRPCVREYFRDVGEGERIQHGLHELSGVHSMEPIFVWRALQLEPPISMATPVGIDLPELTVEQAEVDPTRVRLN